MARGKKKGSGRGRRGAPIDPATGRFLKTKTTSATTTTTTVTAAAPTATAVPIGPTVTPEQVKEEISGFRKALLQTMRDLEGTESEIQDAVLDGLRKTAEELVTKNQEIFGSKSEKTVDQSAAYEIFDAVVSLGEQAAKARTVEQKRKILQRLRTFKKVAQNVFKGGGKQAEIASKLMDMIAKIEEPLVRETGMKAAAKEKISDYLKELPEKMAAKIPLVGGMISRSLQRRREGKEEEAAALSSLTEEISRAGRTSLYGKSGGGSIGPTPSGIDATEPPIPGVSTATAEPPIPGGSTVAEITGSGGGKGFNRQAVTTLGAILANVVDIKKFLMDRYDPAEEELKNEEARRENENSKKSMMDRMKGLFGKGGKAGTGEKAGKGMFDWLLETGGSLLSWLGETLGLASLGTIIAGVATTIAELAVTIAAGVGALATAIGGMAVAAAPWIAAGAGGAALGLGAAWMINKGVDMAFGTDLSERMFEADTWTFGDMRRDAAREEMGKRIAEAQKRQANSPEVIRNMSKDWRNLPKMVQDKKISGTEALNSLSLFESQNGAGPDTESVRQRILQLDPNAKETTPRGSIITNTANNPAQQTINALDQANDQLKADKLETSTVSGGNSTVIAPTTTNNNTTVNNNSGSSGVRNNDPTLKAAERATMP
jgi:hypothetical protein